MGKARSTLRAVKLVPEFAKSPGPQACGPRDLGLSRKAVRGVNSRAVVGSLDFGGLCSHLGLSPQRVYFYVGDSSKYYREYFVKKRNGGERKIENPCLELKGIQRIILNRILYDLPVSDGAFGFVRGKSTKDAAEIHHGKRYMAKFDIEDFFPTISTKRIFGLLQKLGFSGQVSWVLARLTTNKGHLPQGAPTSPQIANLMLKAFDDYFLLKTKAANCAYTRYADDIAISTDAGAAPIAKFLKAVPYQIEKHGFKVKRSKTVYRLPQQDRGYLGIQTSKEQLQPSRRIKREIRNLIYLVARSNKVGASDRDAMAVRLRGLVEYYSQISGKDLFYRKAKEATRVYENSRGIKEHDPFEFPGGFVV